MSYHHPSARNPHSPAGMRAEEEEEEEEESLFRG
jgi:hypothetical protein